MIRIIAFLTSVSCILAQSASAADAKALWSGKVQKIFDVNCVKCHGPLEQKSGMADRAVIALAFTVES